jgi:transcriptional regulator with XRE-family HTH domain
VSGYARLIIARRLGENVARHRKERGWSQEDLGYRAGMHRSHVGKLERGESLARADVIVKLAGALGISVHDLLEGIRWEPGHVREGGFDTA